MSQFLDKAIAGALLTGAAGAIGAAPSAAATRTPAPWQSPASHRNWAGHKGWSGNYTQYSGWGWDAWGWSGIPGIGYPLFDHPNNFAGGYPCGYGYYAYYGCPYPNW